MQLRFATFLLTLLAASLPGFAAAQASDEVAQVYQKVAEQLTKHDSFAVDMTLEFTISVGSESETNTTTYSIAYKRPDEFALIVNNPQLHAEFYLDGQGNITHYLGETNQYAVEQTDLEPSILLSRAGVGPIPDAMVIFMEVLLDEPFALPVQFARNSEKRPDAPIAGRQHDVVHLDLDKMSWTAWVTQDDQPVIRRIIPKLTAVEQYFTEQTGQHVELQIVMDFEGWTFEPEEVQDRMTFKRKDSAERVESFVPQEQDPKEILTGKPAPSFELTALDGSTFNLDDKIGNEIIVLDFWATWCAPCRRAMPIIDKVTKEFAGQGVKLYTVNLQEDEATIRGDLEETNLDLRVLMDTTGSVQAAYHANAIPQTVIIGKNGLVEVVHVGVAPDLEQVLRSELATLAQGGSFVSN